MVLSFLVSASTLSLVYDANGNLISGDGKFRIYNGFNKLVQVRNGDNATAPILENYTWHPMEDRIFAKSVYQNGSWQETVFYITKDFIRIKNATGTFDYKYIYQNGQLVAQQSPDGSKLFFHNDNKGSTSLVTNESGDVVEETFYEPFGKIISGGTASRFQYEGKEYSSVVGDYDFHARKMNPDWGVFTQPDTIIQNVYDPQMLNRYSFERNNPVKYVDPTGRVTSNIMSAVFGFYFFAKAWNEPSIGMKVLDTASGVALIIAAFTPLAPLGAVVGVETFGTDMLTEKLRGKNTGSTLTEEDLFSKEKQERALFNSRMQYEPSNNNPGFFQSFMQAPQGLKQTVRNKVISGPSISNLNNRVSNANSASSANTGTVSTSSSTKTSTANTGTSTTTNTGSGGFISRVTSTIKSWFKSFFGKSK